MYISSLCLLTVEPENPKSFAFCFWVKFRLLELFFINRGNKYNLFHESMERRPRFTVLDIRSQKMF